jgi:hypothetical protein
MTAPVQKKTRRGGAGSIWGLVALEIARVFYRGLPLFVLGLCLGLMIGVEGVR